VVRIDGIAEHVAGHPPATDVAAFIAKYTTPIQRIGYTPERFAAEYSEAIRVRVEKIGR
jgi:hypothetical protein